MKKPCVRCHRPALLCRYGYCETCWQAIRRCAEWYLEVCRLVNLTPAPWRGL